MMDKSEFLLSIFCLFSLFSFFFFVELVDKSMNRCSVVKDVSRIDLFYLVRHFVLHKHFLYVCKRGVGGFCGGCFVSGIVLFFFVCFMFWGIVCLFCIGVVCFVFCVCFGGYLFFCIGGCLFVCSYINRSLRMVDWLVYLGFPV